MKYYYTLDSLNRFTSIIHESKLPDFAKPYRSYFESDSVPEYIVNIHGIKDGNIVYIGPTEDEIKRDTPKTKDLKIAKI